MSISSKELEKEKSYLETTKKVIKEIIDSKEVNVKSFKERVIENKKFIWQNLGDMSEVEMYTAMDDEDLNVTLVNADIIKVAKLYKGLENPYFGKVVFDEEEIYIGLTGVDDGNNSYVYDWRAPISNIYYNFEKGPAFYETPDGVVKGDITLKRQFKIEMGELIDCFDNDVSIDDEMLQEVLLSSSDEKMKNIVNTIQKEQNEVIRYRGRSNLVIQGVAGSGKTSVALHRIAYLIYNTQDLTSNNILIFSPNEVFTNYISNVLPELGENNALTTTWSDFAKTYMPKSKLEGLSEFIERHYESNSMYDEVTAFKMSPKYKKLLDKYLEEFINNLSFKKSLGLKKVKVSKEELNYLLHETSKRLSFADRIDYITEKLCNRFDIDSKTNSVKLNGILRNILDIKYTPIELYKKFLESDLYRDRVKDEKVYDFDSIDYEDIFGILYLYFEINGYPVVSHIKHIVIDEAQDYTLLQFEFLKKIFKNACFTILGDKNQVINPYHKYETLEDISKLFKDSKYIELKNTYRSSAEIIDYTNQVLNLNEVKSIRKKTDRDVETKIEVNLKEDILLDIAKLQEEGLKRIAIITKTSKETEKLYKLLGSKTIGLITDSILKSVVILPSYLSKGLEFDAVISYNSKDNKYTDSEKYLFYVVLTRAQHALIIYNQQ